jgi:predicted nucleic acid-binding protein
MTNPPPRYVLDANVFIEAHQRYYAFDVCPGFWECLLHHHRTGRIVSIDRVRAELVKAKNKDESEKNKPDELERWVKGTAPKDLFETVNDQSVMKSFAEMMAWVQSQSQYTKDAKKEFVQVADGWLAAYAKVRGCVVVTHEVFARESKRRVPLPNVCKQFGVAYQNTFSMLRELEARFFWKP